MLGRKKQLILSFVWVLANLIAVIAASLVVLTLYVRLEINRYVYAENWLRAVSSLAICGIAQGLIVGGLPTIVFKAANLRVKGWFTINLASMTVGMILPIMLALIINFIFGIPRNFDGYVIGGWLLSWILAGVFSGFIVGRGKNQKIAWGLINIAAYLLWGIATIAGIIVLGAALDNPKDSSSILLGSFSILMPILAIGAWLNNYIFLGLMDRQS